MDRLVPRLQVFEIDDQPWFPSFLRSRVQTVLTGLWTAWVPPLQSTSPAAQTAAILLKLFGSGLGDDNGGLSQYTVVDFCSGAGGPTPAIESLINNRLYNEHDQRSQIPIEEGLPGEGDGLKFRGKEVSSSSSSSSSSTPAVSFILTDLAPHPRAWSALSSSRSNLHYIATPTDATAAPSPSVLLSSVEPSTITPASSLSRTPSFNPFDPVSTTTAAADGGIAASLILRTFHLSFHHFPDALAVDILRNTFETADAIVIVELIERSLGSLVMEAAMLVPVLLLTPFWSLSGRGGNRASRGNEDWGMAFGVDWVHLVFTYLVPIVPAVVVFDGWMSSLRARTEDELRRLVDRAVQDGKEKGDKITGEDWAWEFGRECHTWPVGYTTYFVGRKKR